MKRPISTLALVGLFVFPMIFACNQAEAPEDEGDNNSSGSGNSSAGNGGIVVPGAGTGQTAAGTGSVTPTGGSGGNGGNGGSAPTVAGTSAGGSAGSEAGGAAGSAGTATGGSSGGSAGGGSNPACPVKIDSMVMCTQIITCDDAYCGVFQMGSKDCSCAAASGAFTCSSCDYTGRTEEIVLPPAAVLPACAADDTTLEKNTPTCTKGERCKSLTVDKNRFCACWESPADGTLKWDCDAQPAAWPM